jgi:hypothetical protein
MQTSNTAAIPRTSTKRSLGLEPGSDLTSPKRQFTLNDLLRRDIEVERDKFDRIKSTRRDYFRLRKMLTTAYKHMPVRQQFEPFLSSFLTQEKHVAATLGGNNSQIEKIATNHAYINDVIRQLPKTVRTSSIKRHPYYSAHLTAIQQRLDANAKIISKIGQKAKKDLEYRIVNLSKKPIVP